MPENSETAIVVCFFSFILFVYWFRYVCGLILAAKPARNHAGEVAQANHLRFHEVQSALSSECSILELAELTSALDRDYRLLVYLLERGGTSEAFGSASERRILQIYYQVLLVWYSCVRAVARDMAQRTVENMTLVVAHLASRLGERLAARTF